MNTEYFPAGSNHLLSSVCICDAANREVAEGENVIKFYFNGMTLSTFLLMNINEA